MIDYDIKKLKKLVEDGLTIVEISKELKVSISTVKRTMSKLEIRSKTHTLKNIIYECLNCKKTFTGLKSESRKFCCSSCSSKYNNQLRKKEKRVRIFAEKEIGICRNCNNVIVRSDGRNKAKYCSIKCQVEFQMYEKVKSNKASFRTLKLFLKKQNGEKCMKCGWSEINPTSGKIPIELEHIDGNSDNNRLENLTLLCPNCHSLTPTYKGLNKGNGRHKRRERYKEGKSY